MEQQQQQQGQERRRPINPWWTHVTEGCLHAGIRKLVVFAGTWSATYPLTTVVLTVVISFALLGIGYLTNFELELNQLHFVTPTNSLPDIHSKWIQNTGTSVSGFPNVRVFYLNIHSHGENILNAEAMTVALEAMGVLQTTTHYEDLCHTCSDCSESYRDMLFDGKSYCRISSVTQFWNHSLDVFTANTSSFVAANGTVDVDDYVRQAVSHPTYPDGTPVYHEAILGKYEGYNTTSGEKIDYSNSPPLSLATLMAIYTAGPNSSALEMYLTSAQCLAIKLDIPDVGSATDDFETQALRRLADLQEKYQDSASVQLEYFTMNGYQYEMMRALYVDMPLVGVLIIAMMTFCVLVFSDRHDRVQSRGILGVYAFSTVGLSLLAGFGFMWCIGVPLTTVSILIPFVVCGVGLDDTFIITGAYFRRLREAKMQNQTTAKDTTSDDMPITSRQERSRAETLRIIRETLDEVAVSITMTTATTLLAFITSGFSKIPAVRWLCWYATVSLFMGYVFENTCFIALLVLDERRVQANRKDLCIWIVVHDDDDDKEESEEKDPRDKGSSTEMELLPTAKDALTKSQPPQHIYDDEEDLYEKGMQDEGSRTKMEPLSTSKDATLSKSDSSHHVDDDEEQSEAKDLRDKGSVSDMESLPTAEDATLSKSQLSKHVDDDEEESEAKDLQDKGSHTNTDMESLPTAKGTSLSKSQPSQDVGKNYPERIMGWYADLLLKPISKVIVLLIFAAYLAGTIYSTTLLHQEFNIDDYIPDDSYMSSSMRAYEKYSSYLIHMEVYFRHVDQSDPETQLQMMDYVQELSGLDQVGDEPGFFWLRDFRQLAESNQTEELIGFDLESLSFNEQVNLALAIPQLRQIYGRDIVRDPVSGNITASRAFMFLRDFDLYDIPDQINLLMEQRDISLRHPANDPSKLTKGEGLNFFTFAELYFYWELFATAIDELIFNTISCVVVVSITAFLLVPHWTAVCYVCPLLIMLYFNLMGTMQYCGITINVISYFILVISIGLLVDFLMHILLKYLETEGATRDEKVKSTLETMGASILMGAFTTFLGVIPMAFSTTKIFKMVFTCFFAIVTLGVAAGLILLPVLLSYTGPLGSAKGDEENERSEQHNSSDSKVDEDKERADGKHESDDITDEISV